MNRIAWGTQLKFMLVLKFTPFSIYVAQNLFKRVFTWTVLHEEPSWMMRSVTRLNALGRHPFAVPTVHWVIGHFRRVLTGLTPNSCAWNIWRLNLQKGEFWIPDLPRQRLAHNGCWGSFLPPPRSFRPVNNGCYRKQNEKHLYDWVGKHALAFPLPAVRQRKTDDRRQTADNRHQAS